MVTVFTNGVFDLLHSGHISLLRYARSLGDCLIVGINSDESVKRLKGNNRPIISQHERRILLLELKCVDNVIIFFEDTPEEVIKQIKPDILVKGPEALKAYIPGSNFIKSYGGRVVVPQLPINQSTSKIINKILCKNVS